MRLKQLDGWRAGREFVATDEFTVADILVTHVLGAGIDESGSPRPWLPRLVPGGRVVSVAPNPGVILRAMIE